MKKVIISIHSLMAGGVEKSLVSFLSELEKYSSQYEIDLLVPRQGGLFFDQIPQYVKILPIDDSLYCMNQSLLDKSFWKRVNPARLVYKILWHIQYYVIVRRKPSGIQQQLMWSHWQNIIKAVDQEYDIAISYTNGPSNYLIIDKIRAKKKILWLHNEYQQVGYDKNYDEKYYNQADQIVTISNACVDNFLQVFPKLKSKMKVLENISSASLIRQLATNEQNDKLFIRSIGKKIVLLSVGRLDQQKGFDVGLEAAKILKEEGVDYDWYIMGEGPEYRKLIKKRKLLGIEEQVHFLGLKKNPYYFIAQSDIFVQPSRFEGKSIVLDEAKILAKPIVVTNYTTVGDSITDYVDGLIVDFSATSIAEGIMKLCKSQNLREKFSNQLKASEDGNSEEIRGYLELLNEV